MNKNFIKYAGLAFISGAISKILDALVKFLTVPLLLNFFGINNFGVLTLAISLNTYLNLLDAGVNTGAVKYFSEWIHRKRYALLDSVARTSISFYILIGLLNAILLLILSSDYVLSAFSLNETEAIVFKKLIFVLICFSVFNWVTSVFNQLLVASEKVYFINSMNLCKSLLNLLIVFITIYFKLEIQVYFFLFTGLNLFLLITYVIKVKSIGIITSFLPGFNIKDFSIVFKYSLAILSISIFQVSANRLRPIILGFAPDATKLLAEYRIMETISIFIISIGGMLGSIFLPKTAKLLTEGNYDAVRNFVYKGTLITSVVCTILCGLIILLSNEILILYVGYEYTYLTNWLKIWILTILIYLHNIPANSLLLAIGKTKDLVFSTAISCIFSIFVNYLLINHFKVGSTVIGYSIYISMQMLMYYLFFNKKLLNLNSFKVFKSFIKPSLLGVTLVLGIDSLLQNIGFNTIIAKMIVKGGIWLIIYGIFIFVFRIFNFRDFKAFLGEVLSKSNNRY
ncbi:lipopolysaccharide biosynthesis protein [Leadbetterella byssophila]|uniref:lipopolysaccharide biosynthesis protein n=1 Tax=Leadbetterella byssophila TaxID=316068 RepID=UPI00399FA799